MKKIILIAEAHYDTEGVKIVRSLVRRLTDEKKKFAFLIERDRERLDKAYNELVDRMIEGEEELKNIEEYKQEHSKDYDYIYGHIDPTSSLFASETEFEGRKQNRDILLKIFRDHHYMGEEKSYPIIPIDASEKYVRGRVGSSLPKEQLMQLPEAMEMRNQHMQSEIAKALSDNDILIILVGASHAKIVTSEIAVVHTTRAAREFKSFAPLIIAECSDSEIDQKAVNIIERLTSTPSAEESDDSESSVPSLDDEFSYAPAVTTLLCTKVIYNNYLLNSQAGNKLLEKAYKVGGCNLYSLVLDLGFESQVAEEMLVSAKERGVETVLYNLLGKEVKKEELIITTVSGEKKILLSYVDQNSHEILISEIREENKPTLYLNTVNSEFNALVKAIFEFPTQVSALIQQAAYLLQKSLDGNNIFMIDVLRGILEDLEVSNAIPFLPPRKNPGFDPEDFCGGDGEFNFGNNSRDSNFDSSIDLSGQTNTSNPKEYNHFNNTI